MKKPEEILAALQGEWEGNCRTWPEPGKLSDESAVKGKIYPILGGAFLRHDYQGEYQGKPRSGEETIVFNPGKLKFEIAWMDTFHMSYGIMFSEGDSTERGFAVLGSYDIAPGEPAWGWRTVFDLIDDDHLTITAYNISPDGQAAKGVETSYTRCRPEASAG